jgi:hypothetical protein
MYDTKEAEVTDEDPLDGLEEQEAERLKELESRVSKEEVWRDIVSSSNGRDKAFVRTITLCLLSL